MFLYRPDSSSAKGPFNQPLMLIKGGYNLAYECADYTPMVLSVHIRPEETANLVEPETFTLFPETGYENYIDSFGNSAPD
jgi:hypothetical protein